MLISPAGVAELIGDGTPVTLLDVRWRLGRPPGREDFELGHLPGATFVDLGTDLAAPPGKGGRHPLPAAGDFEAAMRRVGVTSSTPVVCYDARDGMSAARCWWLLEHFGHSDVRLLDGGFEAWVADGRPSATGPERPVQPGDFTAGAPTGPRGGKRWPVLSADEAAELARVGLLLDARAGERYRGETEPIDKVAGHIPGAVSAPTSENLASDGRWLSPGELRARFEALGAGSGAPVGAYCGSGVTAAHEVFALALAGIDAALYVGSWSEWSGDPDRPVATGPQPG